MQKKILVVEDNAELSDLLHLHLSDQSWQVDIARDGHTGLGLAITGKILERHGAPVRVESKPGQGACFSFSLPPAP